MAAVLTKKYLKGGKAEITRWQILKGLLEIFDRNGGKWEYARQKNRLSLTYRSTRKTTVLIYLLKIIT